MRKLVLVSLIALSQLGAAKKVSDLKTEKDKVSYIIGHQIGGNFKENSLDLDLSIVRQGMEEGLSGKASLINPEESQKIMTAYRQTVQKKQQEKAKVAGEKNAKEGKEFLEKNAKQPGVVKTASGLQYKVITEGKGPKPTADSTVVTHYKGTLIDGTEFDSSYKRKEPATFPVKGVIRGWTEALQLMPTGSKWQLFIPSDLAYGENPPPGSPIGPSSVLVFEIELVSIKEKEAPKK